MPIIAEVTAPVKRVTGIYHMTPETVTAELPCPACVGRGTVYLGECPNPHRHPAGPCCEEYGPCQTCKGQRLLEVEACLRCLRPTEDAASEHRQAFGECECPS